MASIPFDNSYARLPEQFFARTAPASVPRPQLIECNRVLAHELGLDPDWLVSDDGLAMLSGNALPDSAEPIAMAYAGHQFGGFSPQLGDGRALLIGELVGADGVRRDIQLKGSGQTPFSRRGDGKAPLGPVIREYLVSEAMAALGIPTTRALAAVTTGETVYREEPQPGGVLTRVARSHVRVGTFEFFAARGQEDALAALADYVIERHYPEARQSRNPYRALLEGVVQRQAELIARWMQVGFIHGVMNTDNMQIAGETIDFGPCAFMETFDPQTVFSSIDQHGRYAWGNQPGIGQWNLSRLAEALLPLLAPEQDAAVEEAKAAVGVFAERFDAHFLGGFCEKLGISPEGDDRAGFVQEALTTMKDQRVDFTLFFRHLTRVAEGGDSDAFVGLFADSSVADAWLADWRVRVSVGSGARAGAGAKAAENAVSNATLESMKRRNPIYIPRNHRVEEAIQAGLRDDFSVFKRLNSVWAKPFEEQPEHADLERPAEPGEVVERTFCGT